MNPHPSSLNPRPSTLNPQPPLWTLKPPNLKPQDPNHKPQTPNAPSKTSRYLDKALRIPVSSAYRDGEVFVMGKIESGRVAVGQDLVLMPKGLSAKVLQVKVQGQRSGFRA